MTKRWGSTKTMDGWVKDFFFFKYESLLQVEMKQKLDVIQFCLIQELIAGRDKDKDQAKLANLDLNWSLLLNYELSRVTLHHPQIH